MLGLPIICTSRKIGANEGKKPRDDVHRDGERGYRTMQDTRKESVRIIDRFGRVVRGAARKDENE